MNLFIIRPNSIDLCSSDGCRRIAGEVPGGILPALEAMRPSGVVFLGMFDPNPIRFLCHLRARTGFENVKAAIIRSEDELGFSGAECTTKDTFGRFQTLFRHDDSHSEQVGRKFVIDIRARELSVSGKILTCSPMEFRLLVFFLRYPGVIFSRQELLQRTSCNGPSVDSQIIDVMVRRIRMKIERDVHSPGLLRTARGLGYRFTHNGDAFLDRITNDRFVAWPCGLEAK